METKKVIENGKLVIKNIEQPQVSKDFIKPKSAGLKTLNLPPKKEIGDLNPVEADYVYNKLFTLWENEKSRKFIKHLISSFFPYKLECQLFEFNDTMDKKNYIDAITNKQCTGIMNISKVLTKFGMKKMVLMGKAISSGDDTVSSKDYKALKALKDEQPDEIKFMRIAIKSDKSDKVLSRESNFALHHFVLKMMEIEELNSLDFREVISTVNMVLMNKMRRDVRESAEQKKKDVTAFKGNSFALEGSNLDKLEALKEYMESKENRESKEKNNHDGKSNI